MLNNTRMVFGVALLAVLGVIVWAYVTGAKPALRTAPHATTTPPVAEQKPPKEENTAPAPLSARVSVDMPKKDSTVGKTFTVKGKAPGNWFFEASFPIQVRSEQGDVLGRSHGQAEGEWMTTALVPFAADISLDTTYTGPALLILMRDNPSGMPENDDSVTIPIVIR